MKDASGQRTQVQLKATFSTAFPTLVGELGSAQMNASGRVFTFDGFLKVMKQSENESGWWGRQDLARARSWTSGRCERGHRERARDQATRAIHRGKPREDA